MTIYIALFAITLFLILFSRANYRTRLTLLILIGVVLWLIAGTKGLNVGTDTQNYYRDFTWTSSKEFGSSRIFSGIQIGWFLLNSILSKFMSWQSFQLVCYGIIVFGFLRFIYKNSPNWFVSLFLFVALYFYEASFNIMRQYIAMAMVCAGMHFLNSDRKKFVILTLLSATIHFSMLVALLYLLIDKIKITNTVFVTSIVFISIILGYMASAFILRIVGTLNLSFLLELNSGAQVYLDTMTTNRSPIRGIIYSTMFLISYFLSPAKNSTWIKSYLLFVILFNLFGSMQQGNRIFFPFELAMLVAIPEILEGTKHKRIYTLIVIFFAAAIFFYSLLKNFGEIVPYYTL